MEIICKKCGKEFNIILPTKGPVKVSFRSLECFNCGNSISLKKEDKKDEADKVSAGTRKRKK